MGQTRPLLVLFSFFSHNKYSTNTINDKSVDGVHGRRRRFHWAVMAVMAVMYLIIYCTYVSKQAASHRPFQFLLIGKTKWGGTIILLLWWFQEMQNHSFFPRFGQKICFLQFSTIFSPSRLRQSSCSFIILLKTKVVYLWGTSSMDNVIKLPLDNLWQRESFGTEFWLLNIHEGSEVLYIEWDKLIGEVNPNGQSFQEILSVVKVMVVVQLV